MTLYFSMKTLSKKYLVMNFGKARVLSKKLTNLCEIWTTYPRTFLKTVSKVTLWSSSFISWTNIISFFSCGQHVTTKSTQCDLIVECHELSICKKIDQVATEESKERIIVHCQFSSYSKKTVHTILDLVDLN